MSFFGTHSSGILKPQPGLNPTESAKLPEHSVPGGQLFTPNREQVARQTQNSGGFAAMVFGSKVGVGAGNGKAPSFHAESSGWNEEPEAENEGAPRTTFLARATALPWKSQDNLFQNTLNFLS